MAIDTIQLSYFRYDPFRTTAWRWEHAQQLLKRPCAERCESGDPWVNRALRHLSADTSTPYASRSPLPQFDPSIRQAHEVYDDNVNVKGPWFLEALLMTGEPLPLVAERCGLPIATVEAYGELFFDVRSRLHATDWLLIHAVRSAPFNNFAGADAGCLWRYFAWAGGIDILDAIMAATGDAPWPAWVTQSAGSDDPEVVERLKCKIKLTYELMIAQTHRDVASIIEMLERLRQFPDCAIAPSPEFRAQQQHEQFLKSLARRPRQSRKNSEKAGVKPKPPRGSRRLPLDDAKEIHRKPR